MESKTAIAKFRFFARNIISGRMLKIIKQYCQGDVLDAGGRDFFLLAKEKQFQFTTWTNLDNHQNNQMWIDDKRYRLTLGDGCAMPFVDNQYDTVINIQVLEHVLEPLKMVREIARVLKVGGYAIFLIPQTAVIHEIPHCYYNFSRYWIKEAMKQNSLEIVMLKPMGGNFSTIASHLLHSLFQIFRAADLSSREYKRDWVFYLLSPWIILYALINIPLSLFLNLGKITEGANNHLVVVQKGKK